MRRPPVDLTVLASLLVVLAGLLWFIGAGRGGGTRTAITGDSSAVVIVAQNYTSVPIEVFVKTDAYDRLEPACPPSSRCLYVLPSARLGTLSEFRIACLARGDTEPQDSPPERRVPGTVNAVGCMLAPGKPAGVNSSATIRRVY